MVIHSNTHITNSSIVFGIPNRFNKKNQHVDLQIKIEQLQSSSRMASTLLYIQKMIRSEIVVVFVKEKNLIHKKFKN